MVHHRNTRYATSRTAPVVLYEANPNGDDNSISPRRKPIALP